MTSDDSWEDYDDEPRYSDSEIKRRVGKNTIPTMEEQGWTTIHHPSGSDVIWNEPEGREYPGAGFHFEKHGPLGTKSVMSFDFHPVNEDYEDQEPAWHMSTYFPGQSGTVPGMTHMPSKHESFVEPRHANHYHTEHVMDLADQVRKPIQDATDYGFTYHPQPESAAANAYTMRDLGIADISKNPEHLFPHGVNHDLFQRLNSWEDVRFAAAKKPKPKKPRKPEEVWQDVHKHPQGVPGGMGKSPEHHLKNRGWTGHEINESAGRKTIQYRNQAHPDFVIQYGGGSSTKPDHNFRVTYMGGNPNIPMVTRAYSVAEAMNKVDELHALHNGLVVQPMTHGAAAPDVQTTKQLMEAVTPGRPKKFQDMTKDDYHPIGDPEDLNGGRQYPTKPDAEEDWYQVKEIEPTRKTPVKASAFQRASSETWEEA